MRNSQGHAPNFTTACVFMFGVNIAWVFVAIWAIWGLVAVAALGWAINRAITFFEARRG